MFKTNCSLPGSSAHAPWGLSGRRSAFHRGNKPNAMTGGCEAALSYGVLKQRQSTSHVTVSLRALRVAVVK
jgi:hypothetical protein